MWAEYGNPQKEAAQRPEVHHYIGESSADSDHIGTFLSTNAGDPALQVSKSIEAHLEAIQKYCLPRGSCQN